MTGDTHYDLEILAELAEGLLDVSTARQVREHLAVCDPCGELLADLAAVREVLAATPTPAMPMGVALRIDKALAAEAESRRGGGVGLAETPDWDELMRDSPWERPVEVPEPVSFGRSFADVPEPARFGEPAEDVPEPVRLGVVSDDGTIVPARRSASRRRRWAMPAVAAAAAAVVVGTAVASTGLLAAGGGGDGRNSSSGNGGVVAQPSVSSKTTDMRAKAYALTDSGHNYSDQDLRQPLEGLFGFARIVLADSEDNSRAEKCVSRVASRSKLPTYAVDQGQYNGQEALVIASWKDKASKKLRIDIVDPFNCKNLRKPTLGRW
ncbi:anti-sigma factor family protein [Nonomuraea zeae]|uniref:Zf-HC2 domain-containing protein n=1 Tax=Nonomuraea zeae TaxID=1642303 RepID=A0A5S4GAB4_9ACTN|nr:zf-HC2 domain-containing protein [Nonomuraea zeae]TMR29956.1 zf-HC2 domain-containing protein [Nonomuraea zeae]